MPQRLFFLLFLWPVLASFAGTPQQRYSDAFYAAQKTFYREALKAYPKLSKEKAYPEVPLVGEISKEKLANIAALQDFQEAKRTFANEVNRYPELLYPAIFQFLYNHPALQVSAGNKSKFEALERYFAGFHFLFCNDRYYYFHPGIKANPVPLVWVGNDPKKNMISINLSNASKTGLALLMNEQQFESRLLYPGKRPVSLKAGSNSQVKLQVNSGTLMADSVLRVINLSFYDPAQPKIKIMVPVILLPSSAFLKAGLQFFGLNYNYSTHLRNIDLYSERSSGPEPCAGQNCSGERYYGNRQAARQYETYHFGEGAELQYHVLSRSAWPYKLHQCKLEVELNELGEIQGKARDCPGPVPNSVSPCPKETANNGKELYGSRKLSLGFYVPNSFTGELQVDLNYSEAQSAGPDDPVLSWLDQKKLLVQIQDESGKLIRKELLRSNAQRLNIRDLPAGLYSLSVFPVTEDSPKQNPSFEIKHLNQAARARFDFLLKLSLSLSVQPN